MLGSVTDGPAPTTEEPAGAVCAFCGRDEDVEVRERLGVEIAVCRACTRRFATPAQVTPAPVPGASRVGLPPTLGEHSSAVVAHVTRMARLAAARSWSEEQCPRCSGQVHLYPGADGDRVALDKEPVLAASVPVEVRWRVQDGRALDVVEDDPDQVGARIRHEEVCGAGPEPGNARLRQLWAAHRAPA